MRYKLSRLSMIHGTVACLSKTDFDNEHMSSLRMSMHLPPWADQVSATNVCRSHVSCRLPVWVETLHLDNGNPIALARATHWLSCYLFGTISSAMNFKSRLKRAGRFIFGPNLTSSQDEKHVEQNDAKTLRWHKQSPQ